MKFKVSLRLAGTLGLLSMVNSYCLADVLPGPALPEQVSKSLSTELKTPSEAPTPAVQTPQAAPSPLGPQAEKIKFTLNGIVLTGNHVYTQKQLALIYKDKLHKSISVAALFQIVQDITNYYRNNGYIISRAVLPPQHVKNGVVHVQIVEGFADKVTVTGTPNAANCLVRAYGRQIVKCRPLKLSRMEKYMLLANEIPYTQVKAVLSPSKEKQGAADLSLVTKTNRINGYVSYDDYGTRYIGPQQMTANLGVNSFFNAGDSVQATMTKTPKGGELTFSDINYNAAIDDNGVRWLVGWTRAHTHPLFVLRPAQVDGINLNYYTSLLFPIIRTRTKSLNLTTGFNYLDSNVLTFTHELYTDHVRSLDFGLVYNFSDSWRGANLFTANFRKGLPILGYTSNTDKFTARTSHPGGYANYSKIVLQLSRIQGLKGAFSAYGILRGQWAFNPLLASEQYAFGGSQLGRGYDVAELIGDRGAAGSLELRADKDVGHFKIQHLQFYVFYDAGEVWNIVNLVSALKKVSGTSTGFGMRFFMSKYVSGNVMWTQTLTKQVAAEELIGDGRRPRVFFSLVAQMD